LAYEKIFISLLILAITISKSFQRPANLGDEYFEEFPVSLENGEFFEGDMMGIEIDTARGVPIILSGAKILWPGGVVPYTITPDSYNATQITQIEAGLRLLENSTKIGDRYCTRFVPRTNEANWVRIYNGGGCSSYVGKNIGPGEQLLSLKKPTIESPGTCLTPGIIAHEFIHALGLYHEQSRPDRDDFVNIYWDNIETVSAFNFNKYSSGIDLLGFPYDYDSLMHYGSTSFGINNSRTIYPKIPGLTIGQRSRLSNIDASEIRKYYKCV